MNAELKEFLMSAYAECNENIRDHPKHRDQIIMFYGAVCAFYFSQLANASNTMFNILNISMIVLGLFCSFVVIQHRSWTLQYNKSAEMIGKILASSDKFRSVDDVMKFINDNINKKPKKMKPFFFRMGNAIILGFFIITLAPFAVIFDNICNAIKLNICALYLCIAGATLYFAGITIFCYLYIRKIEDFNFTPWIINLLDIEKTDNC
ncbi:MAG: hypothetical protein IJP43_07670 [Oscillospiraceae bacterium]|nr:hypothetical protein [Oscillospiraceae bacterium]